ncbi:hypothetical protein [Streptomyces sp. AMCC400023]|uniref:hypothetical protein n=1 Tax=Streptomyces sp. AMCC400023 TaxID=2056258 RepID=UPI001F269C5E|nr:hypothetical protein [Streptomyces sp. AMCC400023]UJV43008.1 hypothetical protein CVT30_27000 [Streptomyces sp. AMCC400023]
MTDQYADLDAFTREYFSGRDHVREAQRAREAAAQAPPPEPTIIPMPEYPRAWPRLFSGVAHYRCTVPGGGCMWVYDVDLLLEDSEPLRFPVCASLDELNRHLNDRADRRVRDLRQRIETAFRDHFRQWHPGQEPPEQWPPAGVSPGEGPAAELP